MSINSCLLKIESDKLPEPVTQTYYTINLLVHKLAFFLDKYHTSCVCASGYARTSNTPANINLEKSREKWTQNTMNNWATISYPHKLQVMKKIYQSLHKHRFNTNGKSNTICGFSFKRTEQCNQYKCKNSIEQSTYSTCQVKINSFC